ncbi:OsmC family protein [Indiicoccus explosivorum]|uniref:OsmC family protein n=1 Tax=Indiicoccus explosivorum TaxID=1917864 RepID=UPI00138FCD23|nr:OsmC family protein [Indiicoccus explosivorum]
MSGALEARQIPSSPDKVSADVQGTIEAPEGVLKITKISCRYHVKVPEGKEETTERVLKVFDRGCPVAQTLEGAVDIEHSWEIETYKA